MPLQYRTFSQPFVEEPVPGGPIFVRLAKSGETSPQVQATLAAADAVFCDDDADHRVVALTSPGAVVEFVAVDGAGASSRPFSIARARRLAGDGWRVVWVATANPDMPADCEQVEGVIDAVAVERVSARAGLPHALATAFNGLAG